MECVPLGGNGCHCLKSEIQGLEAEMHELADEQQLHAELQKRNEMALAEALEEAAAQWEAGRTWREAAGAARSSPPPALCLGGKRMECVPLSGNGCANGPPMGCYLQLVGVQPGLAEEELAELLSGRRHGLNGQWVLPEWVLRAVVKAVEVTRAKLGLKLARLAKKQKRVAKSLANKQARLAEVTQAETQAVVKRYRQAIDEVAEEYVCPITGELPVDPVTAEDGRCYGRFAIEEWFVRQLQPQVKSPVTNEAMGKRLFPAVQLRNSLKRLVESGAISGSKADAWKKAVAEVAEMAALRVTAEGGNAIAMRQLGCSCRDGTRGQKTDLAQSFMWFKRAADLKDVCATQLCGYAYLYGQGVERSAIRGITMICEAATMGSEHACFILGVVNESGRHGFDMNPQEATRWYRKMSTCYYRDSVAPSRENAAAWLREHP